MSENGKVGTGTVEGGSHVPNQSPLTEDDVAPAHSKLSPAFQFYPESWFGSSKVSAMSHTERGIYIDLLARCWLDHGLPVDVRRIAALVKIPASRFQRIWSEGALHECFVERGGKLVNPRQERERQKQAKFQRRQTDNGSKGGRPRKNPTETQPKPTGSERVSVSKPRALETEIETEGSGSSKEKIVVPEFDGQRAFMRLYAEYPPSRTSDDAITQGAFIEQIFKDNKPHEAFATMMDNLRNHVASEEWCRGVIPNLENWLTKGKWKRRYEEGPKVETSKTAGNRAAFQRFIDRGKAS